MVGYTGDAVAEICSGHPQTYFDYIERVYGAEFRAGTEDAIETFALLYQQISDLGNTAATESFSERFVPMLPKHARRKIVNETLYKTQRPSEPSS